MTTAERIYGRDGADKVGFVVRKGRVPTWPSGNFPESALIRVAMHLIASTAARSQWVSNKLPSYIWYYLKIGLEIEFLDHQPRKMPLKTP